MTTLYRTPNVIIDRHEWHAAVEINQGHIALFYRFRPLSAVPVAWQPITEWQGPKPKGMGETFWRFRSHIREAMESERRRKDALAGAARTKTGSVFVARERRAMHGKRAFALVSAP